MCPYCYGPYTLSHIHFLKIVRLIYGQRSIGLWCMQQKQIQLWRISRHSKYMELLYQEIMYMIFIVKQKQNKNPIEFFPFIFYFFMICIHSLILCLPVCYWQLLTHVYRYVHLCTYSTLVPVILINIKYIKLINIKY